MFIRSRTHVIDSWEYGWNFACIITLIINSSLQSGHFPEVWKEAIVKPLLKKYKSDSSKFKNLRPASNLSHISKLTDNVVADQIQSHLAKNNLYPVFQSAYWKLHSRETALAKVRTDILKNMNKHPRSVRLECCLAYCGPKYFVNMLKIKAGSQWNCSFVVLLLSIWNKSTNICSGSAFKCISSSLWRSPRIVLTSPFI